MTKMPPILPIALGAFAIVAFLLAADFSMGVFGDPASSKSQTKLVWKTYTNQGSHFRVDYPQGWRVTECDPSGVYFTQDGSNPCGMGNVSMNVTVGVVPADLEGTLRGQYEHYGSTVVPLTIGGTAGWRVTGGAIPDFSFDGTTYPADYAAVAHNQQEYALTNNYRTTAARTIFAHLVASFRFTDATTTNTNSAANVNADQSAADNTNAAINVNSASNSNTNNNANLNTNAPISETPWQSYTYASTGVTFQYPHSYAAFVPVVQNPGTVSAVGRANNGEIVLSVVNEAYNRNKIMGIYGEIDQAHVTPVMFGMRPGSMYLDGDAGCGAAVAETSLTATSMLKVSFSDCADEFDSSRVQLYTRTDYIKSILATFTFAQ